MSDSASRQDDTEMQSSEQISSLYHDDRRHRTIMDVALSIFAVLRCVNRDITCWDWAQQHSVLTASCAAFSRRSLNSSRLLVFSILRCAAFSRSCENAALVSALTCRQRYKVVPVMSITS